MDHSLQDKEKLILRLLVFGGNYSEDDISVLLKDMDLRNEHLEYPLLVSILGARNDWRSFPYSLRSRFEGIYKSTRLRNIYGIPWFTEQCRILNENGIPVLLLKGMAMRTYYAPDMPRQMADFDVAVPTDRFLEAKSLLTGPGTSNSVIRESPHAAHIATSDKRMIDLHKWAFKTNGDRFEDILSRAVPVQLQDLRLFVPGPETMFIHILDSKVRDDIRLIYTERRLKWLLDSALVVRKSGSWSWEQVSSLAKQSGSLNYLKEALPIFSEVYPELLSHEELLQHFPHDAEFRRWENGIEKYRSVNLQYYFRFSELQRPSISSACFKLKYLWTSYRYYYGPEMKASGEVTGFLDFVCKIRNVSSISDLLKRYIRRYRASKQQQE